MKFTHLLAAIAMTAASPFVKAADETPAKPYPLKTCVVSGEKLGSMGEPYTFTHEGQEIKLCCGGCKSKFDKDPAAAMKKVNAAAVNSKSSGGAN